MTETNDAISPTEFGDRLVALCMGGDLTGLPRRQRDVAILLASATLWMETGAVYREAEVNEGLRTWLDTVCPALRLDMVTLRRELVDRGYLDRDDSGRHYSPGPGPATWRFDDAIAGIEPRRLIAESARKREARKRAHLARKTKGS